MAGGPNSFPDPRLRGARLADIERSPPSWRPNHMDGQLTLPSHATAGRPSNEEVILAVVPGKRMNLWKAVGEVVFLADWAAKVSFRKVE